MNDFYCTLSDLKINYEHLWHLESLYAENGRTTAEVQSGQQRMGLPSHDHRQKLDQTNLPQIFRSTQTRKRVHQRSLQIRTRWLSGRNKKNEHFHQGKRRQKTLEWWTKKRKKLNQKQSRRSHRQRKAHSHLGRCSRTQQRKKRTQRSCSHAAPLPLNLQRITQTLERNLTLRPPRHRKNIHRQSLCQLNVIINLFQCFE